MFGVQGWRNRDRRGQDGGAGWKDRVREVEGAAVEGQGWRGRRGKDMWMEPAYSALHLECSCVVV